MKWERGEKRPFKFDDNSTVFEGRFRLLPLEVVEKGSCFRRQSSYIGISYIMGKRIDTEETTIQSIRFNKKLFTEHEARLWWNTNKSRFIFYTKIYLGD